jgi:lysophospholipase L1-like esterase
MNRYLRGLAFVIYVIFACAIGGEIVARGFYGRFRNYNMEMWRYAADLKEPLDRDDLPFHHRPGRCGTYYGVEIKINSLGFRDSECSEPKPGGERRIVFLGDSFTLGWGVSSEETFPRQVEKAINASHGGHRVINLGIGNYNMAMELELFKWKGVDLEPDVVVLMYFINDTEPVPATKSYPVYSMIKHSYFSALLFDRVSRIRSRLVRGQRWDDYYAALYSPDNAENMARCEASAEELITLCRGRQIGMLIVNIPELHDLGEYRFSYATEFIQGLAEAGGVPFLDLRPALARYEPASLWVSAEDHHANAMANAVIADEIYTTMLEEGLIW